MALDFTEINPPERKRTYHFAGGTVEIPNVSRVCVRPSGNHRIETTDGKRFIVNAGWLAIELEVEDWTF